GRQVELLDGRLHRAHQIQWSMLLFEVGMQVLELSYLSIGPPLEIAEPGVPQVKPRDPVESPGGVEARCKFQSERLVVNEAVCAGRVDRLFVQAHRVQIAILDSGHFGADQGGTVLEVLRAILGPDVELSLVKGETLQMPLALVVRRAVAT